MRLVAAFALPALLAIGPLTPCVHAQDVVVISDLHLGYGRDAQGWRAQEEARDPKALATFLQHLDKSTNSSATLALAGDVFELWEADPNRCVGTKTLGCTEHD